MGKISIFLAHGPSKIHRDTRNLLKLTRQIRGRRVAKGALELASQEAGFGTVDGQNPANHLLDDEKIPWFYRVIYPSHGGCLGFLNHQQ